MAKAAKKSAVKSTVQQPRAKALGKTPAQMRALTKHKAAQEEEARLEARRTYKRERYARLRAERDAAQKTKSKPAAKAAVKPSAAQVVAAEAMTLSKAELVGAIKAAMITAPDVQERLGLHIALRLAEKLAD